jgi:hypothetical protein
VPASGIGGRGLAQQSLDRLARVRLLGQGLGGEGAVGPEVAVERLVEQGLLTAECRVQAGRADTHRLGEQRDGRRIVAVLPEHHDGPVEGLVTVEGPGSSPWQVIAAIRYLES